MINKKSVWLRRIAGLAISPLLVATAVLPWDSPAEAQQTAFPLPAASSSGIGGLENRAADGAQPKPTEPLNAPPVPMPISPPGSDFPGRSPKTPEPLPVPPTPLNAARTGRNEPTLDGPPERFSVSPLKTPGFFLTGQEQKNNQPPDAGETPAPTPPTSPMPTPSSTPSPYSAYEGLPKLGGSAPATQAAAAATAPSTSSNVSGQTSTNSGSVGDLLSKSNSALGVEVQKRSPLVGDPRIEGLHFGQVVTHADGAYWFPARVDLDTVVSKINATDIENILIIKGPYSVRYGAGFSFLDIQSLGTPRYKDGFEAHGSSSLNYRTNGQGWSGQQSFWGGSTDWGFRISYDLQTAIDYTTGAGTKLPSGYNNQFVNFAYGFNLSPDSSLELKYLHAQQSNVVFPGLLTDINNLATDAFNARYTAVNGAWYDRFTLDAWVNNTTFNGDSANPGTRRQISQLDDIFAGNTGAAGQFLSQFFPARLDIVTNGNALSYGAREITTWGDTKGFNLSLGADVRVFSSNYNEFDSFNFSIPRNFGIPYGRQIDPGLLLDMSVPLGEQWLVKAGTRIDFVTSQFLQFGPSTDVATYLATVGDPRGDRSYTLFSGFVTGEYAVSDEWKAQMGYGYAERAPTLTELYSGGAFLGLIQNGFNSIYGAPNLSKEAMHQLNLGLNANYDKVRAGVYGFYAFMPNYITYRGDLNDKFFTVKGIPTNQRVAATTIDAVTPLRNLRFHNTRLATMFGFDAYTEVDATPYLTPFFTLNFTEGWDQSLGEALPGIAPLSSRVGLRLHAEGNNPKWGIEYFARMVARQDLFAASLGEQTTGGFVTHNLRGYWQATEGAQITAGIENIGDLFYREHLDLRTGTPVGGGQGGVFQPGINFYAGVRLTY